MATPTVREMVKGSVSGGPTNQVALGAGTAVGDVVYCFWVDNFDLASDMATPVLGTGGTWNLETTVDKGTDLPHMKLWTITMTTGGANTVTITDGGEPSEIYQFVYVVSGVGTINDGISTRVEPSSGTTIVMPSITPVGSDDLLLAAVYAHPSVTNITFPGTMTNGTEEEAASFGTMGSARQNLGAGATGTRTFTTSNTRTNRIGIMIAIAGASATFGPPIKSRSRRTLIGR